MNNFKVGDKVWLNPTSVDQWKRDGNFWWNEFMDDETDELVVVEISRHFVITESTRGKYIRLYPNDYTHTPIVKQSKLCRKINKLYKQCPTTAHWEVNNV